MMERQLVPGWMCLVACLWMCLGLSSAADVVTSSVPFCGLPESVEGTAYVEDRLQSNYTSGDLIVHICGLAVGFGSVSQRCMPDGTWSAPDRRCNDPPALGGGTAVGIAFATLNIFFVLTVLLRHWFNPALEPEGSSRDHPI